MLHAVLLTHSALILLSLALIPILGMNKPGGYSVVFIWAMTTLVCWASLLSCRLTLASHLISWIIFTLATTLALLSPPITVGYFFPTALYFATLLRTPWGVMARATSLLLSILAATRGH